jgi:hypothetical protein
MESEISEYNNMNGENVMLPTVQPSLLYLLQRSGSAGFSRDKINLSERLELAWT